MTHGTAPAAGVERLPAAAPLRIVLAQPRGFCAGVVRAIEIVERALAEAPGRPVYVRHQIVHNHRVVEELAAKGARFVDELDATPAGATTVYSAHGVPRSVEAAGRAKNLDVLDATCPLVRKVHRQGQHYAARGYDILFIGHAGHPEVVGTLGQIDGRVTLVGSRAEAERVAVRDPGKVAYITQTTLSVRDTRDIIEVLTCRFPSIVGPDTRDICYATQNRQTAVIALARMVDLILVIGARNSSNSNRLREIGEAEGVPSLLIDGPWALTPEPFAAVGSVGITAGASAPESLVQETVALLGRWRPTTVETLPGEAETIRFRLPARLEAVTAP